MLISKKLGDNIKKIRTRKGMSQGDICRALDMDRGYMSAIENGKKNITISQLERLAQALEVSVDKLLKYHYEKEHLSLGTVRFCKLYYHDRFLILLFAMARCRQS